MIRLVVTTLLVLGLAWWTSRLYGRSLRRSGQLLHIVESQQVGRGVQLCVVRVGGSLRLLGITPHQVSDLGEIAEAASAGDEPHQAANAAGAPPAPAAVAGLTPVRHLLSVVRPKGE